MNTINFDWLPVIEKIFDGDPIIPITKICLKNSGFISGGGARTIARLLLGSTGVLPNKIKSVRNSKIYSTTEFLKGYFKLHGSSGQNKFWKAGSGDIDIFFPTAESAWRSHCDVKNFVSNHKDLSMNPTEAGWGFDVCTKKYRGQLITKVVGSPKEITDSFDIINGTCWLGEKTLTYSDRWLELENANLIGLQGKCDKHNLAWRVSKWIWKGNYSTLSQDSQSLYLENCLSTMKEIRSGSLTRFGSVVKPQFLKSKFRDIGVQSLTNENLLYASFLLDDYEQMDILRLLRNRRLTKNEPA